MSVHGIIRLVDRVVVGLLLFLLASAASALDARHYTCRIETDIAGGNEWMVCAPDLLDKATLELQLVVPPGLKAVASGEFQSSADFVNGRTLQVWRERDPVPAYTFGFSIGRFNEHNETHRGVSLRSFSEKYSVPQLDSIFTETGSMIDFLAMRAGVPYPGISYSQIIGEGNISQEMSGFCVLWNGYGAQVLGDSTQVNLSAHELAHQWWGNRVTCESWKHFWLNEGLAVYMSSAYKEDRFGRAAYLDDIEFYRTKYESVPDRPLQFPDWDRPTKEDRTIVYFKGAYFLHLLREKVGDAIFWEGIRIYTTTYFGGTVVSSDLQKSMEAAGGSDLGPFFSRYVY